MSARGRVGANARRVLLVVAALAAVLLGGAVPASAHAALLGTAPAEGSVVAKAPARITLHFSEGVLLSADSLVVYDPAGRPVQLGAPAHAGGRPDSATIGLRPGLRDGTYTVAWKAVSADTHPVSGAWTFSVGAPSKTSAVPRQARAGGGVAGALYGAGRYAAYLGYAVLVGSAAFLAVCWPRGARSRAMRRLAVGGWATLAGSTIALLLLRGPYVNGTGLGGVLDPGGLRAVVETRSGEALVCRLLLLAAAAVFLSVLFGGHARQEEPDRRPVAARLLYGVGALLAVAIAATWSLTEHASVGIQPGLAMPLDVAHLLAMAVWLGGLAALLTALYRTPGIEAAAVRRFSRIAFGCVCVLVATGVYQSWRQVGSWHALGGTAYGRWLVVKVALVACVVGAAWFSRRWTAQLADQAPAAARDPAERAARRPAKAVAAKAAATGGDPVREAQLARQRAALERTNARKEREGDPARTGLRTSVLVEASVAVVVLVVATILSGSEPGRAAEESAAASAPAGATSPAPAGGGQYLASIPFDTGGPKGRGDVGVHLAPARTGSDVLHLDVTDPAGNLLDVPEVDASLTLTSRGIGPLPVKLVHPGPGAWAATGLRLPLPGEWRLAVTVRTSAIDEVTVYRNVAIG